MTDIEHTGSIMAAVEGLTRAARRGGDDDREDRAYDKVMALVDDLAQQRAGAVDALKRIRDHGQTHDEPCWALHQGDCADAMQEIARAALAAGEQ